MTAFFELERDVNDYLTRQPEPGDSDPSVTQLKERLLRFTFPSDDDGALSSDLTLGTIDGEIGMKRKLYV